MSTTKAAGAVKAATKAQRDKAVADALVYYKGRQGTVGKAAQLVTAEQLGLLVAGTVAIMPGMDEGLATVLASIEQRAAKATHAEGRSWGVLVSSDAKAKGVHKAKAPSVGRVALGMGADMAEPMRAAVRQAQADGGAVCASSHAWAKAQGAAKCLSDRAYGVWCLVWADEAQAAGRDDWSWPRLMGLALAGGAKYGTATTLAWSEQHKADPQVGEALKAHQAQAQAKATAVAAKAKAQAAAKAAKAKAAAKAQAPATKAATTKAATTTRAKATKAATAPKAAKAAAPKATARKAA